jgi:serine/threonine protein kinase/tetratricopeptide (TPR) repeat protein
MAADPRRVKELFVALLDLPDAHARQAFLERECAADADLRQRLEALLKAHENPASVLDRPLAAVGPEGAGAMSSQAPVNEPVTTCYRGPDEDVGSVIAGRYKLLEQIGEGGMGTVWVAEQTQPVRRKVALKLIKAGMDSKNVLSRFEAERQALALMDHPNIAKVLDGGTTETGRPFFVMEYVKGVPFTRYCDDARLSIAERLALFVPVCHAVQHAHQKGIIHRDLKPSNILICLYDGKPVSKVIDFGLAKAMHQPLTEHTLHTAHGAMMGTPLYMSPEQAEFNNLDVDTRTDIYALGVILYELLTGTTPLEKQRFHKAAWHEILRLIKEEEPPRPSARLSGSGSLPSLAAQRQLEPAKLAKLVRGELDWIVMKCLAKDRSRRYDTANGLARDVERYLADEVVEARPPSKGYRLRKLVRRNKGRVLAGSVVVAMLFLVIGLIIYGVWWTEQQAARKNNDFKGTLDRIEAALTSSRIDEAGTLLGQTSQQIDDQTTAELRERHERLEKYQWTVHELNDIFEERWMISRSDTHLDNTRAKERYPALFRQFGLAVGQEPAEQSVQKMQRSLIADALSSGMAEWFFVDPKYPGLLGVVDLLDPEPERATLRAAIANGDAARISDISKTIDGSRLGPTYAIGLATHPACEHRLRILRAAWTAHPNSFALVLAISSRFARYSEQLRIEAIGWGRTAVALRPNNALAHYYLALALGDFDIEDRSHAVAELRRATQLAPRFARAFGQLALTLKKAKNPEASAAAHKAIEIDPQNICGQAVLLWDFVSKKDYIEAAKVYWRLAEMKLHGGPSEDWTFERNYALGAMAGAIDYIQVGLIRVGRPFEAYRLKVAGYGSGLGTANGHPADTSLYNPACAAALAGTGQGLDAPPPAERAAIRKHALEWPTSSLKDWRQHATALHVLAARSVSLAGSPFGGGPLLSVCCLSPERTDLSAERARDRKVVHKRMNEWLQDSDLAGVRDDPWLAKLPAEEREQWQRLWKEVRFLRDGTAPKP